MNFKIGEHYEIKQGGIYHVNGVVHDDEKVYGIRLNDTHAKEEEHNFSDVIRQWFVYSGSYNKNKTT